MYCGRDKFFAVTWRQKHTFVIFLADIAILNHLWISYSRTAGSGRVGVGWNFYDSCKDCYSAFNNVTIEKQIINKWLNRWFDRDRASAQLRYTKYLGIEAHPASACHSNSPAIQHHRFSNHYQDSDGNNHRDKALAAIDEIHQLQYAQIH